MNKPRANWKQFELAVADFLKAIGRGAKITHDAKTPDANTGYLRQRDVWIEWALFGHFPTKALISCKYLSTPLDQQDIDHFNGEYISSKAKIGIIYSKSGFNVRAIEKSKELGFHCCKLYRDEPAEIPDSLSFGLAYHFRPQYKFLVHGEAEKYDFKTWNDVFRLTTGDKTVFSEFVEYFDAYQKCKDGTKRWELARTGDSVVVGTKKLGNPPLSVEMQIKDQAFQARIEYTLLNGSYNITAGSFLGTETTPWIDMMSTYPGDGWIELSEVPAKMPTPAVVMYAQMDAADSIQHFGDTAFPNKHDQLSHG